MATFVPPSINQTASLPYAPGTRKDCYLYATGSELQVDLGASSYDSTCELIAAVKGISPDTLLNWSFTLFSPKSYLCLITLQESVSQHHL
jgi:hypothetical protein